MGTRRRRGVRQVVEQLFQEVDVHGAGRISAEDVVAWVGARFRLDSVAVPGQSLERNEIAAVRARMDQTPAGS
jgi:hypothetical protein